MAEVKEFELKISTKQAQENVDELNKSLEAQVDLIDDIEKELSGYEKKLTKTSKTNLAARKSLNDKIKQTKERLKEEKVGLKDVTKERNKSNETLKEATANSADYGGVLGMIDSKTGGLISGLTGMTKSIGGATKGFNLMKVAIIGTGIGALLIGILAVSKAFTSSEEGQNKFAKIMAVIGSVTGNLVTMLSDLGMMIIGVFENPKQALIDFKDAFIENITNRISSAIETIGFLGSAIKKVFSGDFSGAMDDAKSAGSSYVDTLTGVKGTIDKVSESVSNLAKEIVNEGKAAANIADQRAKADKLDRKLTVERAEANKKRAELLDKAAQKDTFNAGERIRFLEEAALLEEEITNKEIESAKLRFDAKVAENALANSTKEDLEEEANLKAQLINLETAKLRKAKAVSAQIVGAKREEEAELKAIDDKRIADEKAADAAELKAANDLVKLKGEIAAAEAITEEEKRALEIQKVTAHYDKLIELAKAQGLAFEQLEKAKAAALDNINEDNSKNEINWEELTQDQKVKIVSDGFNNLATILGEETVAGKAAAIAAATIDTFQSASASYKSLAGIPIVGPALGAAAAGAAIASGFKQVKAIRATKIPTIGGKTPPSTGGGSVPSASIPQIPNFNTVGASSTNQLADAIGGQTKQPIKTYVVASDVTTAQNLERNIITGATVG
tara:strand:+ start:477 stop:2507 length:2031 start_codon:yes stop_codon:yes gene_type:complete